MEEEHKQTLEPTHGAHKFTYMFSYLPLTPDAHSVTKRSMEMAHSEELTFQE